MIWFNQLIQPFRETAAPDPSIETDQPSPEEHGDSSGAPYGPDDDINRPQPITNDDLKEMFVRTQRHIKYDRTTYVETLFHNEYSFSA